jgi:hypothetical protein
MKERLKNYFRIVITMFENWPPRLIFSHFGKRQFKKKTIKKNNKNVYFLKNSREQKCEKVVFLRTVFGKSTFLRKVARRLVCDCIIFDLVLAEDGSGRGAALAVAALDNK